MDNHEFIRNSSAWCNFEASFSEGIVPHTLAIRTNTKLHHECAVVFAEKLLCLNGHGNDDCISCREWHDSNHPDLLIYGTEDKAPGINVLREMMQDVSLKPVISGRRVAAVLSADKLSVPASNSLLKLTEEPPNHSVIILLFEEDNLIPTLRSRSRFLFIPWEDHFDKREVPEKEQEWIDWIATHAESDMEDLISILDSWIEDRVEKMDFEKANRLESIRLLAKSRKLSRNMIFDMISLFFKEGFVFDDISGDLW
ncbi:MAG TPA: hypothetical protein PLV56_00730 [Synergistales bacterium]|nr:hypothetical protein [Synergistales bacterium]